ncbi:Ig-like domain-containing protein [Ferruginibacter yonginensis]|uniref:Ig-like domain-containing protein n=1 Tax=Ferruginibacter yonginensis TaxID=1310416 RepID=A0ABV8QTD4_9BACT
MKYVYAIVMLFVSIMCNAQTDVSWDFGTTAANGSPSAGVPVTNLTISALAQGNNNGTTTLLTTASASTGYTGASGQFNAGAAARIGAINTAASGSAYFEFSLTPAAGSVVTLNNISFGTRSTGTGPQAYTIRTSNDNYVADVATGTIANNSAWSLKSNTTNISSGTGAVITFRIYGHNGAGSPGAGTANWRIDDLKINVTVAGGGADVTPPTITTLTPADNATNVSTGTNLSINFSEPIIKNTGNIIIKKISDNSTVQTIDVTSAAVTTTTNNASITINALQPGTAYYINIDATAFKDAADNLFAGINDNSTWNFTTGTTIYNYNFNTCTSALSDGFTAFSVTGPQVWACTTFGHDAANPSASAANGVQINGFASGSNVINEDWLISPAFNLVGTQFPLLSFWSRTAFNGTPLKLRVSTNYPGTGNPNNFTWVDLNGQFPVQASDIWTLSQNINLSAYKTANTYIAFVYNSTDDDGARWTLDDIKIDNSPIAPPATLTPSTGEINFGFVPNGNALVKTMNFVGNDITGGVTVTANGNFLISKTNGSFTNSISYTQAEANNISQTVYVQFTPTAVNQNFTGTITYSTPGVADTVIVTRGNSIDAASTLDVVNWNIEWFGSTTLGPTNDNQQEQNIKTILQNLNADVYALEEVVSEPRLANIVSQMPGYSYVLSNYGSYTNPNQPGAGPLSEAQKLGMIYKTSLFPGGVTTQALLSAGINSAADISNPAYNWYASGRFPFMVTGTTTLNGVTKTVRFVIVHAKANTSPTLTSYNRRKAGNDSLRTFLNNNFPNDNIIMLGDFNDDLDSTITAGITPKLSSYKQFIDDAGNYFSPTLALSLAGKKSTVSYNDVIDHVLLSNEMKCNYLTNSASILTDVTSLVTNYGTTTTDHYPVYTRYLFQPTSSATISYAGTPYCSNAGTANVTLTGTTGGTFSAPTGLVINPTTGAVNLSASTPGSYVVTYTIAAIDACNPAFSTTATIVINAAPNASFSYAGTPYCSNAGTANVTFTGTTGGTFSAPTGLVINPTTGAVNTTTSIAGAYVVTYTVAANGGCAVFTTTATIVINAAPSATISYAGTPYCSNAGTATVTRTGTAGGSYTAGTGLSINATTGDINIAASTPGTYTVTYTIAANGGCATFSTTATVTINAAPSATISYAGTPYCANAGTASVTRTGTAGGTYTAATGLSINASTGDINIAASTPGSYTVTYTIAANGGCATFSTTAPVVINTLSTAPTAATTSATQICGTSGTVTLTAVGGTLGTGASYKWYAASCGGTLVGTGAVLNNVVVTTTTTYFVRIEGVCNTTACASVTVNVAPTPVITVTATPSTGVTPSTPVTLTASVTPSNNNYFYQWVKNGTTILNATGNSIVVTASEAGNYVVNVTQQNSCGASSSNVFVNSAVADVAFVFPNPNRGIFNVAFNNGGTNLNGRTVTVYDNKGSRVFEKVYNNNVPFSNMKVDISQHAKGQYFIIVRDAQGKKIAESTVVVL